MNNSRNHTKLPMSWRYSSILSSVETYLQNNSNSEYNLFKHSSSHFQWGMVYGICITWCVHYVMCAWLQVIYSCFPLLLKYFPIYLMIVIIFGAVSILLHGACTLWRLPLVRPRPARAVNESSQSFTITENAPTRAISWLREYKRFLISDHLA